MIERVAKAIGDVFTAEHERIVGEAMDSRGRASTTATVDDVLALCARAALAAMRTPTEDMKNAGCAVGPDTPTGEFDWDHAEAVFTAMIDASLSPTKD